MLIIGASVSDLKVSKRGGNVLGEGAVADTTSTDTRWDDGIVSCRGAIVWNEVAITRHAVLGAVKDGRVDGVGSVLVPCPVWLVSIVATLCTQSILIGPGEIAVPGEEVPLASKISRVSIGLVFQSLHTVP